MAILALGKVLGCQELWLVTAPDYDAAQGIYNRLAGEPESSTTRLFIIG